MRNREQIERVRAACIQNAEELLNAAKQMAKPGTAHIAYHLVTLALEEVGKSSMIFMSSLRDSPDQNDRKGPVDWIDDHERKLFWAIWSPRFDKEAPWQGIQQAMDVGKAIHATRLATLYVDPDDPDARLRISENQLQNLLKLAEAQLELEKLKKVRELQQEEKADLDWFFIATNDPQLRQVIFSKGSLEKQAEFDSNNDPAGWIHWLRTTIEESNRLSQEMTRKEMNRVPPEGEEGYEDKWEITIRLKSWSHSIRPKQLQEWNKGIDKIKLFTTTDKRELLVKFVAPKKLQAQMVWYAGQQTAYLLVIALNIGTTGFFWWYVPTFVSKYAEKIRDLEERADVVIERVPQLQLSWGNLVLTSEQLNNVGIVLGHLARIREEARRAPYMRYFRALALMAKNDIFFQFEGNVLVEFYLVMREAMAAYGDWDGKDETFNQAVDKVLQPLGGGAEFAAMAKDLVEAAELTRQGQNKTRPITLEDVAKMKVICDAYLNLKARQDMQEQIAAARVRDVNATDAREI
jgi:AbiV family abortive infection protein